MSADWIVVLDQIFTVLLLCLVVAGTAPVAAMIYQFLILPIHAFVNHYKQAEPYWPRVAVIVPAWNEGLVIGASIDRMLQLDYPADRLRIYVVDDASTDDTPEVVQSRAAANPGRVFHLRRAQGGEGKAHTLNHGIERVLAEPWAESILIMDADVIFARDSLAKMTRHLADRKVGAVTAYVSEGSRDRNYVTRFVAFEYIVGQLAARRAQNVLGAIACLAGGAQLHSRENLEAIGGRIPTGSLAEDTVTTFESQLRGRRMIFEPRAVVYAEEPRTIDALWKQRLRWGRGNVQITSRYRKLWFRPSRVHRLGSLSFGLIWFSILLLPVLMVLTSIALVLLLLLHSPIAEFVFRLTWIGAALAYIYSAVFTVQLDPRNGLRSWREAILFPGLFGMFLMVVAIFPGVLQVVLFDPLGVGPDSPVGFWLLIVAYLWAPLGMLGAWLARLAERTRFGRAVIAPALIYLVGYGSLLCVITVDSYIKEWRGADASWTKTEKVGRVFG